jgi:predicted porin
MDLNGQIQHWQKALSAEEENGYMTTKLLGAAFCAVALTISSTAFAGAAVKDLTKDLNLTARAKVFTEMGTEKGKDAEIKSTNTNITLKFDKEAGVLLNVFGELSGDIDINGTSDTISTRFGYIGIKNDKLGALSIGKTMSIMDVYVDKADVFQNSGNQGVQKTPFKLTNSWKYEKTIGDFGFGAQGQIEDDAKDETFDLVQYGVTYKGIGAVVAIDQSEDINYYGVGAKEDIGKFMAAGSFTIKDAAVDVRGYELAVGYMVTPVVQVIGGWQDTDATADDGNITAGAYYTIGKAQLFAEGDYDLDSEESVARIGLDIKF